MLKYYLHKEIHKNNNYHLIKITKQRVLRVFKDHKQLMGLVICQEIIE
jgi:hypothetical protein